MANQDNNTAVQEQGSWVSWADFLGTAGNGGTWSKKTLLKFLEECRDQIVMLESSELLILLANAGLEYRIDSNEKFKAIILNEEGSDERIDAVDAMIEEARTQVNGSEDVDEADVMAVLGGEISIDEADVTDETDIEEDTNIRLSPEGIIEAFKIYDHEYIHLENLDQEKVKFLIQNRINKLWNDVLNDRISIDKITEESGGKYFTQIQEQFLAEHKIVSKIKNPKGYRFVGKTIRSNSTL